jgi:nucleoside-diphosphate-sugar epimerase
VFFLYGPYENESRLVPSVINSLLNASEAKCTEGKQIRDFLYVEDVADALVALLDSEVNGPVNIASGKPIALNEIIFTIADMLERRDLVRLGALPTPGNETPFVLANAERLFNEVGWKPACTIETGLRKSIEWWKRKEDNKDCG